jgi:hypothetical protein
MSASSVGSPLMRSAVDVYVSEKPARPRARRGDAFALWGENERERAMLKSEAEIDALLTWLHHRSRLQDGAVATAVFGSTFGDLVLIALASDNMAYLGVVFHSGDRNALEGDDAQVEPLPASFPLLPEPVPLTHGNYVRLAPARDALVRLVLAGSIDRKLPWTSAMHGGLLLDLPRIMTERGFTVPLPTPFRRFAASELPVDEANAEKCDSATVADSLVGALVKQNAIELTGKRGETALRERITNLLDAQADGEPLGLMDALMNDPNVVDVFVDETELDALLAGIRM